MGVFEVLQALEFVAAPPLRVIFVSVWVEIIISSFIFLGFFSFLRFVVETEHELREQMFSRRSRRGSCPAS